MRILRTCQPALASPTTTTPPPPPPALGRCLGAYRQAAYVQHLAVHPYLPIYAWLRPQRRRRLLSEREPDCTNLQPVFDGVHERLRTVVRSGVEWRTQHPPRHTHTSRAGGAPRAACAFLLASTYGQGSYITTTRPPRRLNGTAVSCMKMPLIVFTYFAWKTEC